VTSGRVAAALAATALIVASCGGDGTSGSPGTCRTATSGDLNVIARNTRFDTDCLSVPAGADFRIIFENHDPGVPHTIAIYAADPSENASTERYFEGARVQGPGITTYDVPGMPAGTHFFRCEVHPTQMSGTFVVEG
jgi:plastocyanin